MSDYEQQMNLLNLPTEKPLLFKDVQTRLQPDNENGTYQGSISFDCLQMSSAWTTVRDHKLLIPLKISLPDNAVLASNNNLGVVTGSTGSAGGATVGDNAVSNTGGTVTLGTGCGIAFRDSVLSLISGLTIGIQGSATIVSEINNCQMMNNLRLQVEHTQDWLETNGNEYQCYKNTFNTVANNSGFNARQEALLSTANIKYNFVSAGTTGTAYISSISTMIYIGLKDLSGFFNGLDFPTRGVRWSMSFQLASEFLNSAIYPAFSFVAKPTSNVNYQIGGNITIGTKAYTRCEIVYKHLFFNDEFQAIVAEKALKGQMEKRPICFSTNTLYVHKGMVGSSLQNHSITTGVARALKLWVAGFLADKLTDQVKINSTDVVLSSLNCVINSVPKYDLALDTQATMWAELKGEMPFQDKTGESGSLLKFSDYYSQNRGQLDNAKYGNYNFSVIPLSRRKGIPDNQATTIQLNITRCDNLTNVPCDIVMILEREVVANLRFSDNTVAVIMSTEIIP